jgi:hypothetical protein
MGGIEVGEGGDQTKLKKNLVYFSNWILRVKEKSYSSGNGMPGKRIKNLLV